MIFKYFTYVLILQKCYHISSLIACLSIKSIKYIIKASFYNYPQSPLLEFRDLWLRNFSWRFTYKFSFNHHFAETLFFAFVSLHIFSQRFTNHYTPMLQIFHEKWKWKTTVRIARHVKWLMTCYVRRRCRTNSEIVANTTGFSYHV